MAKTIAIALRNASKERRENRGSIPSIPGNANDPGAEKNVGSTPSPAASSASPGGDGANQSPAGDSSSASPASGGGSAGPNSGMKAPAAVTETAEVEPRPVLTMVQHLCVSAPERAEARARVAGGLKGLLPDLEESDRERFVKFLVKVRDCVEYTLCCTTYWNPASGSWSSTQHSLLATVSSIFVSSAIPGIYLD